MPEADKVFIRLLVTLSVGPDAVTLIPAIVAVVRVEESVLIVLALIVIVFEGFELAKPITVPPVPEEVRLVIVLLDRASVVAKPVALTVNPVIASPPVILVMVLVETEDVPPNPLIVMPVTADVPPVQLLNVFPVIVFAESPASVLLHPAMIVAPVTVMFEKLLPVLFMALPAAEVAEAVNKVRVPPSPVLLKPVTIELLFTF